MTTLSDILNDKNEYTKIDLNLLGKQKGFYYNNNFTAGQLSSLQGPLNSDTNSNAFSIILFHNNTTTDPHKNTNMTTTPNQVQLNDGEISTQQYTDLSTEQKNNYSPVYKSNGPNDYVIVNYKLNPTNTNPTHVNKLADTNAEHGGGGKAHLQKKEARQKKQKKKTKTLKKFIC